MAATQTGETGRINSLLVLRRCRRGPQAGRERGTTDQRALQKVAPLDRAIHAKDVITFFSAGVAGHWASPGKHPTKVASGVPDRQEGRGLCPLDPPLGA
ncbi:MAG: hypothetical protein WDN04_24965 [Rhodospirillales bacterium]